MEISVDQARTHGGPHVAVTTGTVIARKALEFAKVSGELERQFNDDPDGLWGLNIATLDRMVMTITFWASQEATDAYVNAGAHRAAMRAHYEFPTDDHDFVSDGGFFGFSPYRMRGTLAGKNPFPAGLAAHIPDGF